MNKSNLQKALAIVKPGLSKDDTIDQATSFAFKDGMVITYNDEISISHPVEGLEIEGAIKADTLYGLLSKIKKEEIQLTVSGNELQLESGRAKATFAMEAEVKLPLEEVSQKGKFKKLPENFIPLLIMAIGSTGNSQSDPKLTCVNVSGDRIEASDGFKIFRGTLPKPMPVDTFMIPAASANLIARLSPSRISMGEGGWVHFKTEEGTEISCRTFEEEFVEISHLLAVKGPTISFPSNLSEVIERANIFAKRDSVLEEIVNIKLSEKKVTILSTSEEGKYEESVKTSFKGDPCEFNINPYLLKGILAQTTDCVMGDNRLRFAGEGWEYITALR